MSVPGDSNSRLTTALESYEADNKPLPPATSNKVYYWRFVLRVGKDLHREVAIRALRWGAAILTRWAISAETISLDT